MLKKNNKNSNIVVTFAPINRYEVFGLLLFFTISFNLLELFNKNYLITNLIAIIFLFFIPGFLILTILKVKKQFWEYVPYMVSLSLSYVMFIGFINNMFLPIFNISQPLSLYPLLLDNDFCLLLLGIVAFLRFDNVIIPFTPRNYSFQNIIISFIPFFFPLGMILGAIEINNGSSNILTMITLTLIVIYIFIICILWKRLSKNIYLLAIYLISLSILFMTSIRGWYITGHDIQREYYVFQLTKAHFYWSMNFYKDAYNACLSITILPTVISAFLHINDMLIYKVIYQFIFALCPVIVMLFLQRYTKTIYAFLASFYFVAFPTFLNDMPMLNRQEIGFLYFCLLLLITFQIELSKKTKYILFLIFGISTIISHYSTAYVSLALLGSTYLLTFIFKQLRDKVKFPMHRKLNKILIINKPTNEYFINGLTILCLIIFTYIWFGLITKTSSGIFSTANDSLKNITIAFQNEMKSADVGYSLLSNKKNNDQGLLTEYINKAIIDSKRTDNSDFYQPAIYNGYPTQLLHQKILPLTTYGIFLQAVKIPVSSINSISRLISAKAIQILILIGIIALFWHPKIKILDPEYLILCLVSIILIALMILLPSVSLEYGLLRLFQQCLVVLALPVIIGSITPLYFLNENKQIYLASFGAILFFLVLTGFISELTGGYFPQLNLDNAGIYYDAYYTHKSEVISITWLKKNWDKRSYIEADPYASMKLLANGNLSALPEILPPVIRQHAFVYLQYLNVKSNAVVNLTADTLYFSSPIMFLDDNKNLIYNNGQSRIYR